MIITVDPGTKASGAAHWTDSGEILRVEYGHITQGYNGGIHLIIEKPVVYRGSPVNPNNLVDLAFAAGVIVGNMESLADELGQEFKYTVVKPSEWKGRIKKAEMLQHILDRLTPKETECLKALKLPKSKEKEVIDALGIGLWYFNRL